MDESFCALLGKKVCCKKTNKCFGRLSDILVSKGTNEIIGIVAKNDSLIYPRRFFYFEDICDKDSVNIFVSGFGEKFMKVVPIFAEFKSIEADMLKRKAVFPDGREAGKIQNINLNMETGTIEGFEIGISIIQDLLNGRKLCRTQNTITFEGDNIVVENNLTQI